MSWILLLLLTLVFRAKPRSSNLLVLASADLESLYSDSLQTRKIRLYLAQRNRTWMQPKTRQSASGSHECKSWRRRTKRAEGNSTKPSSAKQPAQEPTSLLFLTNKPAPRYLLACSPLSSLSSQTQKQAAPTSQPIRPHAAHLGSLLSGFKPQVTNSTRSIK